MVFLGKNVEIHATPELAQLEIGRWVHIGDKNTIRAHEGSLRLGDKVVFGRDNVINCYLDIEFGESALMADWCYVCDFDHKMDKSRWRSRTRASSRPRCGSVRTPGSRPRSPSCGVPPSAAAACWVRMRWSGRHPGLLDRGGIPGQGGQEPQAGLGDLRGAAAELAAALADIERKKASR